MRFLIVLFVYASAFLVCDVTCSNRGTGIQLPIAMPQWKLPVTSSNIHPRASVATRLSHRGGGSAGSLSSSSSKRRARTTSSKSTSLSSSPSNAALSIPQRLLAGGTSRGMAQFLLYPMDALRTLSQTRDGRTLADVGASALVRGCATTSSFAVLIGSIQFAIFGATRETIGPMPAAALGAAGSCLVSVPQEVIKQRLVTGVYSSFRHAVATIWTTEGIQGFYSGWKPTVSRNVPFVVVTFTAMDALKRYRLGCKAKASSEGDRDGPAVSLSVQDNLAIGIGSSLIAATFTHPADVIKTQMMTQAASKAIPYSSTMDCIQNILKTEGIPSFYSGFLQRSLYMGPLWSIQFALNGKLTELLKDHNMNNS